MVNRLRTLGLVTIIGIIGLSVFQFNAARLMKAQLNSQQTLLNGALTTANVDSNLKKQLEAATLVAGALPIKDEAGNLNSCDKGQVLGFTNGRVICVSISTAQGDPIVVTEVGPPGSAGANGRDGSSGANGAAGANGSTGTNGGNGQPGANGVAGPQGNQGSTGVQGAQGSPGVLSTNDGNGVSSSVAGQVLSLNLITDANGGLANSTSGLSLLMSCSNSQILKWNGTAWGCASDDVGSISAGNLTSSTPGITVNGGTGAVLGSGATVNIATATSSQSGLLSSVDWNTFSNKQSALTFDGKGIFSNTSGTVSAGTCSNNQVFKYNGTTWVCASDNDTTYTAGAGLQLSVGNVLSFDSGSFSTVSGISGTDQLLIYDGSGNKKISYDDLFGGVLGSLNYRGTWNANTNSPDLTSVCAAGTKGYYYVVSTSGSSNIGGISSWVTNDWVVCNGTAWQRVQTSAQVASVFGRIGTITAQSGDYNAGQITNSPSGNISSTNTQSALNELDSEKLSSSLSSGLVFVGNGSSTATGVAFSGDATLSSSGVVSIANDAITSAKIADGTIAFADFASNSCSNGQVIKYNGSAWGCGADNNTQNTYTAANTGGNADGPINITGLTVGLSSGTTAGQYWSWNGTKWTLVQPGTSGVTTVGALDSQTKSSNGAVISGSTVYLQSADASNPGLITTGTQTLAGDKTLTGDITMNGALTVNALNSKDILLRTVTGGGSINIVSGVNDLNLNTFGGAINIGAGLTDKIITMGSGQGSSAININAGSSGLTVNSEASITGGLTIAGATATQRGTDYSATGSTNDVNFGNTSLVRLTGASAQTITGIAGGTDGKQLTIINAAAQAATISNQNVSSTAANRILTGTAADLTLNADATISLVYDSGASRWRVVGGTGGGGSSNASVSVANVATDTTVGASAGTTVDVANNINLNQTTTGRTLTLFSPTVTTAGKLVTVANTGTATFTIYGSQISAGGSGIFLWNGTAWAAVQANGSNVAAEFGENNSISSSQSTSVNNVYGDVTGSSFTLPSAGTWEVEYFLSTQSSGSNGVNHFLMSDTDNVSVPNSDASFGSSPSDTAGNQRGTISQKVIITTTGSATYKLRWRTINALGTIFNGTGATGHSKITWQKISGNTPVSGQTVDFIQTTLNDASFTAGGGGAIVFNTIRAGNIPYNTTTGVYTLSAGKTYRLTASIAAQNGGFRTGFQWRNITNNVLFGGAGLSIDFSNTESLSGNQVAEAVITPSTDITVRLENTSGSNRTFSASGGFTGQSQAIIVQLGSTASTGVSMSSLTAAISSNALDNGANTQTWNWNGLGAGNGLELASSATGATGNLLNVTSSSTSGTAMQLGNSGLGLAMNVNSGALAINSGALNVSSDSTIVPFATAATNRSYLLLTPDANNRVVQGIANGSNGKFVTITNVSASNNLILANENLTATAANRITTGSVSNLSIAPLGSASLIYDSTNNRWRVIASTSGRTMVVQRFASNGTYTPTPGMKYAVVEMVGGGGAGGGSSAGSSSGVVIGGGGGSGGYIKAMVTASQIGTSQFITRGGGATGSTGPGTAGGNTTFGTLLSANGGSGGGFIGGSGFSSAAINGAAGGTFTITTGTDIGSKSGASGIGGLAALSTGGVVSFLGSQGGSSALGSAPAGQVLTGNIVNNQTTSGSNALANSGSGGNGGWSGGTGSTSATGGSSGTGLIIITEYFN